MPRKQYSTEQIITKLRQAEVELGRGLKTPQVCKTLGISEQTYYRWRKEFGGLRLDQAKRKTTRRMVHRRSESNEIRNSISQSTHARPVVDAVGFAQRNPSVRTAEQK